MFRVEQSFIHGSWNKIINEKMYVSKYSVGANVYFFFLKTILHDVEGTLGKSDRANVSIVDLY